MFNWTEQQNNKGRLQSLIIEFDPSGNMPEEPEENINGDVSYQLGYIGIPEDETEERFIIIKNANLHFGQVGVIAIVEAIQATSTPAEAKAAIEALLVDALEGASEE